MKYTIECDVYDSNVNEVTGMDYITCNVFRGLPCVLVRICCYVYDLFRLKEKKKMSGSFKQVLVRRAVAL